MRQGVTKGRRQTGSRTGEQGYILALLLGVCTIMSIHLLKAIPAASAEVQRELEAELVYRGEHIANGIQAYNRRAGAYPVTLEQLTKSKPRLIRKLYRDPMTPDGTWVPVYGVQPARGGSTEGLPIVGIHSSSQKDSFRMYRNKTIYSDWIFSAANNQLLGIPGGQAAPAQGGRGSGGTGTVPPANPPH